MKNILIIITMLVLIQAGCTITPQSMIQIDKQTIVHKPSGTFFMHKIGNPG